MIPYLRLLARAAKYRYRKDRHELAALLALVGPGDTVLDIGAHKGAYTYWLARRVGPRGRVVAFEPQPRLAAELRSLFAGPAWAQVRVEQTALSDAAGNATLYQPRGVDSPGASLEADAAGAHGGAGVPLAIARATLDDLAASAGIARVRAIKCDVEGHELSVFRGGRTLLERDRPAILFECEARFHSREPMHAVFDFLRSLGYRGEFFDGPSRRPVEQFDPARHQRPGVRPYLNNFLFTAATV